MAETIGAGVGSRRQPGRLPDESAAPAFAHARTCSTISVRAPSGHAGQKILYVVGVSWFLASALLLLVAGACLGLGVLTAIGQRRRGGGLLAVSGAVPLFPLYWVAWYVHDTWPSTERSTNTPHTEPS